MECGHLGATVGDLGWGGADVGFLPFPTRRLVRAYNHPLHTPYGCRKMPWGAPVSVFQTSMNDYDNGEPKHARRADLLLIFSAVVVIVIAALVVFFR
jgi:hypothetical protein